MMTGTGERDETGVFLVCGVAAMIATALADGELSPAEKDSIVQAIAAGQRGRMSPIEVLKLVEGMVQSFADSDQAAWGIAFEGGSTLPGELKRELLHLASHIALRDSDIQESEELMILQIALWLVVDPDDFRTWSQEFDERVGMARDGGTRFKRLPGWSRLR